VSAALAPRGPRRGELAVRAVAAVLAGLLLVLLGLPVVSLVLRISPLVLIDRLREPLILDALRLSLVTSLAATVAVVGMGVPVAYLLAMREFRGKRVLEALIDLPMVLPPTVAGVALLVAFGRNGLAGHALASPVRAFLTVLAPLAAPALLAGAATGWARALGEFGATITFAGNMPGVTQTMPLAVYLALQSDLDVAIALSVLLLLFSLAVLLTIRLGPTRLTALIARARRPPR
jgi:molybdate transport system permease protein